MKKQRKLLVSLFILLSMVFNASSTKAADPSWKHDFDNDGKTDLALYEVTPCVFPIQPGYFRYKSSLNNGNPVSIQWGQTCHTGVAADYEGDGVSDPAIFQWFDPDTNDGDNAWWILQSSNNNVLIEHFGHGYNMVPRDYDGDLGADPAWLFMLWDYGDPEDNNDDFGQWYYSYLEQNGESVNVQVTGNSIYNLAGQLPAPGDYEGLGISRIAVYDKASKQFWIYTPPYGLISNPVNKIGLDIDYPTIGDYDGNGRDDYAGIHYEDVSVGQRNFVWRVKFNSISNPPANLEVTFGENNDIPAPADYDDDGITDIAVYRPSNGTWYIRRSSDSGTTIVQFGNSNSRPVQEPIKNVIYP